MEKKPRLFPRGVFDKIKGAPFWLSAVKTAIRLSGEKGIVARATSEGARKEGWVGETERFAGGSLRGRRRRVEDEVERMERERESKDRQKGRGGGRERGERITAVL